MHDKAPPSSPHQVSNASSTVPTLTNFVEWAWNHACWGIALISTPRHRTISSPHQVIAQSHFHTVITQSHLLTKSSHNLISKPSHHIIPYPHQVIAQSHLHTKSSHNPISTPSHRTISSPHQVIAISSTHTHTRTHTTQTHGSKHACTERITRTTTVTPHLDGSHEALQ